MKKITLIVLLCAFCLPLSAQTYLQETFDAETFPDGWTVTDGGDNTGDSWRPGDRNGNTLNGTNAAIVDSDAAGSGPHLIETLTSPEFDSSEASFLYVDFIQYYNNIGSDFALVEVFDGSGWVTVLNQTENAGSFANPDYQHINITEYKNENMRIRFHYDDNDVFAWYWLVDNVVVYNETCGSPSNFSVNNVTLTSADISWTPAGSEIDWEIVVQIAGTGVPSGSGLYTDSPSYNATSLTLNTSYEVYIRSNCGDSDGFSIWAGPVYFTTLDTPPPPAPVSFLIQSMSTSGTNRAVVDMNGDFLDDIVSISSTNVNILFQDPDAVSGFTEKNIATPDADNSPSWSLAAADYNADGYTDLLYGSGGGVTFMKAVINTSEDFGPFDGIETFEEYSSGDYVFSQRSNFADVNNDGHLDAFICHDVQPNVYYLNDGSGNLTFYQTTMGDAPYNLGDYFSGGNYGSIWIDYDNDHDLDMFIAKCGGGAERSANQMHTNDGLYESDNTTISYTENAADIGLSDSMQTWSSAWGDFDNDGDMDVFVGASSGTHKLMQNDMGSSGSFTDVTSSSGVSSLTATGIENQTYDFDNDGNLDIFSNGNLLIGNGDMTFEVYTTINLPGSGSFGDLNDDGFIDAFSGSLFRNNANDNNWIKINTVGGATEGMSNINGIGARVELHLSGDRIKIRDVRSGEGFRYMSSLNTHFGLGTDTAIEQIIVYWPSGIIDTINNPSINETLTIYEGQSLSVEDEALVDLVIYPNPVQDILYISTSANVTDKIATIFDINGKRVLNQKLSSNSLKISTLQSGTYILRLESQGKSISKKFIKK